MMFLCIYRSEIGCNIHINSGTASLRYLMASGYGIAHAVLHKIGTGLVKRKCHSSLDALTAHIEHPLVATFASLCTRFATHSHHLDAVVEP